MIPLLYALNPVACWTWNTMVPLCYALNFAESGTLFDTTSCHSEVRGSNRSKAGRRWFSPGNSGQNRHITSPQAAGDTEALNRLLLLRLHLRWHWGTESFGTLVKASKVTLRHWIVWFYYVCIEGDTEALNRLVLLRLLPRWLWGTESFGSITFASKVTLRHWNVWYSGAGF